MATHPHAIGQALALRDAHVRRLCWLAIAAAVLLGGYAGTLAWVTRAVEAGVQRSIQPLPVLMRDRPDGG
jgi:hypothetical protein